MELSEEDRQAFHNQADRVADAVDLKEVDRQDNDRSVRSVFMALNEDEESVMVTMKVLPRHRFLVKTDEGRVRTTRRDEVIEVIQDTLS